MAAKEILFDEEARAALADGVAEMAEVAAITLGPRGRNVGLQTSWGLPTITSDGHSIVKDIELKDRFRNMGVAMGKEVAAKIKEKAGDGTTTGIVLLNALVQEGMRNIAAGASPIEIKRGMDKACEALVSALDRLAIEVNDVNDMRNLANDEEVGQAIAACFEKLGKEGVISIQEGTRTETVVECVEGMRFDRGYASAYFCTDGEKLTATLDECAILVTDKKISAAQDLLPILQHVASTGRPLLIIADEIEGDALSTLVINKLRGSLKVVAVKAPAFGDRRKEILQDIATLTGAEMISEERGLDLRDADPSQLGSAAQVLVDKEATTIIGSKGHPPAIQERVAQIEYEIRKATSSYDKEKLQERKAKLQGGVALIKVGAHSESEMKQKKQRYEDCLNATRAALEGGVLPGGGIALLRASRSLNLNLSPEEALGAKILQRACEAPFRRIVYNAGADSSLILEQILSLDTPFGFNALTHTVENLLDAKVFSPLTIVKASLQHAVSMAGVILLSETLIALGDDS